MTDYSDIPQVNLLYGEQQQVESAIDYLNNGGAMTMMVVSPPPNPPPPDPSAPPQPLSMQMAVSITMPTPNPPDLVARALDALYARTDEINQQLADLGVTNSPTRKRAN